MKDAGLFCAWNFFSAMWLTRPSWRNKKFRISVGNYEFHTSEPCCSGVKKTHYETLGVPKEATIAQIKSAYVDLSKRFHPDSDSSDKTLHSKFVEINEAYRVLSKPSSRREYDKQISEQFSNRRTEQYEQNPFGFHQKRKDAGADRWDKYEDPFASWYSAERQRERDEFRKKFYGNPQKSPDTDKLLITILMLMVFFGFIVPYLRYRIILDNFKQNKARREHEEEKEARRQWFARQIDNQDED